MHLEETAYGWSSNTSLVQFYTHFVLSTIQSLMIILDQRPMIIVIGLDGWANSFEAGIFSWSHSLP